MGVPGLGGYRGMPVIPVTSGTTVVDIATYLGNPLGAVRYVLLLPAAVTAGAVNISSLCINAGGLHVDSVGYWMVDGKCLGAGGAGGDGTGVGSPFNFGGGGGGGGAGLIVGAKGLGYPSGADGAPGLEQTGGAGGLSGTFVGPDPGGAVPTDGGDAVLLSHQLIITGSGQIGGGGGGSEGAASLEATAYAGGDIGKDGDGILGLAGVAGYAIRYVTAAANADISGFLGSIDGNIGL